MKLIKNSFTLLAIGTTLFLASCNGDSSTSTSNTVDSTKDKSLSDAGAKMDTKDTGMIKSAATTANTNQHALDYAVPKNTKEILWLQAGIDRGTNPEIKQHAKMMMVDHKNLAEKVGALIAKKNYTKPFVDTTNEVNINNKSGADWDKAWISKMIVDHTEILAMFGKAKESVTDADLKEIITNTIPVVQKHLDMARVLDKKIK